MSKPTAVLIDLDGTLVDTLPDFEVALNAMLAQLGHAAIGADAIRLLVGRGTEALLRDVLARELACAAVDAIYPQALAGYQHAYAAANGQHSRLFPDVVDGLAALAALGLRIGCVTNKPQPFVAPLLERFGIADYFDAIVGGGAAIRPKPAPDPYLAGCSALGVAPAAAVAIGDSANDVASAHAAGLPVLLVPYGYNHGEPVQRAGADAIVTSLADGAGWIARRLEAQS